LSRAVEVVRTYLELRTPRQLRPARIADPSVQFVHRPEISTSDYRRLYRDVGARWQWHDRDAWSDQELGAYLARPNVRVWECLVAQESAGYFELVRSDDGSVEIAYFGLTVGFTGRGIGKAMLTRAAEEAWALDASRVWLHTCTLDSASALPNYKTRGFQEFRQERYLAALPDEG
jgi:GNAT superfamily N-acetyltransferase